MSFGLAAWKSAVGGGGGGPLDPAEVVAALVGQNIVASSVTATTGSTAFNASGNGLAILQTVQTASVGDNSTVNVNFPGSGIVTIAAGKTFSFDTVNGVLGLGDDGDKLHFNSGAAGKAFLTNPAADGNTIAAGCPVYASPGGALPGDLTRIGLMPIKMNSNATPVGNTADTNEDDLMTYTLPGQSAATTTLNPAPSIRVTAFGTGINTASATTVRIYFGGALVQTLVLQASQDNTWRIVMEVTVTNNSVQQISATAFNGGAVSAFNQTTTTGAVDVTSDAVIKLTGQSAAGAANDIVQTGMITEVM